MRLKTQRRAIYAGMLVTLLALVAGYAVASLTTILTSSNQNGFVVTAPGNTMYAGGTQTTRLVKVTPATCDAPTAEGNATTAATVFVDGVGGPGSCVNGTASWFEEVAFTSTPAPSSTPSDVFTITVSTNAPISVTVSFTGLTPDMTNVTAEIYYFVGTSTAGVPAMIGVSGS